MILVPGFMAGDATLRAMSRTLRRRGFRTYRSHIHANVGCTLAAAAELEARIESIAIKRDSRVRIVGHSLGGMLARGLAVRRPDLVSGIVTMGSPMLAPGRPPRAAHRERRHAGAAQPGRRARADVGGVRGRAAARGRASTRAASRCPPASRSPRSTPGATASSTGGPASTRRRTPVEVTASHVGMAFDPRVIDVVTDALHLPAYAGRPGVGGQCSKSIAEKARSFESWCSLLIERMVPLRERITSESVVQPPAR